MFALLAWTAVAAVLVNCFRLEGDLFPVSDVNTDEKQNSDVDKRQLEPVWRQGTDIAFGKLPISVEHFPVKKDNIENSDADKRQLEPVWHQGTDTAFGKLPISVENFPIEKDNIENLDVYNRQLEPVWLQGTDSAFGKLPISVENFPIEKDNIENLDVYNRQLEPVWLQGTDSAFGKFPISVENFPMEKDNIENYDVDKRQLEPTWRQGTDNAFGKMPVSFEETLNTHIDQSARVDSYEELIIQKRLGTDTENLNDVADVIKKSHESERSLGFAVNDKKEVDLEGEITLYEKADNNAELIKVPSFDGPADTDDDYKKLRFERTDTN